MRILTPAQTASILHINDTALMSLVKSGKIPYSKVQTASGECFQFRSETITDWLNQGPRLKMDDEKYIERLRQRVEEKYPEALKKLQEYSKHFKEPRKPKGYNITKTPNKKLGFVYYARYIVDGKLVPSRWCTHTNDEETARLWAIENRERLLAAYYERKTIKKPSIELYSVIKNFYAKDSAYLKIASKRGRTIGERTRQSYQNTMINHWIPYLRKNRIKNIEEIDTPLLAKFQNLLLSKNIKAQTINHYISYLNQIFDYLLVEGCVKTNPCKNIKALPVWEEKITGCYEINKLKGVFNKKWQDQFSYMLCLLIYTTNMRNIEIERMRVGDIIEIEGCHYINIPKSKTPHGVRIVPLHEFVYKKLMAYIKSKGKKEADYIFLDKQKKLGSNWYNKAYTELGKYTGYSKEKLAEENITFYSGRHFWKTLMNSENLGDVEEYFMGHKVASADVAKRYNHRDKQGKKKLLEKTKRVFAILDKHIF